jgi:hypothetical protein
MNALPGLICGIVAGIAIGAGSAISAGISPPLHTHAITHPRKVPAADISNGLYGGLTGGLLAGAIFASRGWFAFCLLLGLAKGIADGLCGWRYLGLLISTRRWSSRWLPWRLGHFLTWCYDAGLLRIANIGYQFRHGEIQDFLLTHPTGATAPPLPAQPRAPHP